MGAVVGEVEGMEVGEVVGAVAGNVVGLVVKDFVERKDLMSNVFSVKFYQKLITLYVFQPLNCQFEAVPLLWDNSKRFHFPKATKGMDTVY